MSEKQMMSNNQTESGASKTYGAKITAEQFNSSDVQQESNNKNSVLITSSATNETSQQNNGLSTKEETTTGAASKDGNCGTAQIDDLNVDSIGEVPGSDDLLTPTELYDDNMTPEEVEDAFCLEVVPLKKRRKLLKESGIEQIDVNEHKECEWIRVSREDCGW